MNSSRELRSGCNYTTHAEMEALKRLDGRCRHTRRRKKINLIVLRVNKSGELCNSKPCGKCIEYMAGLKNYRINKVYYSDENGGIVAKKFGVLYHDERHKTYRFR